jgi:tetratricopeptide (TPR) repeat protein
MKEFDLSNRKGIIALLFLITLVVAVFYWRTSIEDVPGDYHVKKGNYRLEDGQYDRAIEEFRLALEKNPDHARAYLGLAITHMHMKEYDESLSHFNTTISLDPDLAVAYADRGILFDRMGRYALALADYRRALDIDPKLSKGPGWLWRFLRNVDEKPPTIADRADYIEAELKKSEAERLLKMPDLDDEQMMYKYKF